jgi:hypothetical protein
MRNVWRLTSSVIVAMLFSSGAQAQDKPTGTGFKSVPIVPLKVQIVVSRYEGEKKVSSLPYTLAVNANDGVVTVDGRFTPFNYARLRTGAKVPIPSMAPPKESPVQGPMGPVTYQSIGTNIDCTAQSLDNGRYRVDISIEDTSVYADGKTAQGVAKIADIPSFRTFQSSNAVILRDGQSTEFTVAADKISGDVTKVDVTITVVK